MWITAEDIVKQNLSLFFSGLLPGQIVEIERKLAQERYTKLIAGNAIGFGVALGLDDDAIFHELRELISSRINAVLSREEKHLKKTIKRTRERLHFIDESNF